MAADRKLISKRVQQEVRGALLAKHLTLAAIARKFGVTRGAVLQAISGRSAISRITDYIGKIIGFHPWRVLPPEARKPWNQKRRAWR